MREDVNFYRSNEHLSIADCIRKVADGKREKAHQVMCEHFHGEESTKAYEPNFLGFWPDPSDISSARDESGYTRVDLAKPIAGTEFLKFCEAVSQSVKFPLSTTILHGLCCVASAAVKSFKFEMYGQEDHPVNLFCVTAQPPASGKSAIHSKFTNPIRHAFSELNKRNEARRATLKKEISNLEKQIEESAAGNQGIAAMYDQLGALAEELKGMPYWRYSSDDATPESLEKMAGDQGGMVNVMSSEADAVNILLGNVYSDKKSNHGMFLKMFDGDWHSPSRVTRATVEGPVFGCFGVIAQDESIQSILAAGASGRGISERILLLREKNNLGGRDFNDWVGVDPEISKWYQNIVDRLVNHPHKVLRFDTAGLRLINEYRNTVEPELADGGKYSNNMLRGAIGKADKHIARIACILHLVTDWERDSGNFKVSDQNVMRAIEIYGQLSEAYMQVTDGQGYAGKLAAMETVVTALSEIKEKKRKSIIKVTDLFKVIKNRMPFKTTSQGTAYLKEDILPALIESGHLAYVETGRSATIYISPNL